jgi:hypothetical protein
MVSGIYGDCFLKRLDASNTDSVLFLEEKYRIFKCSYVLRPLKRVAALLCRIQGPIP